MDHKEPIAIVGIGCRFPGEANTPEQFWQLLLSNVDAIQEIPVERWNMRAFYDPDFRVAGKINAREGGFIKDIDKFDARFFGISPIEAQRMDPQQRILLEVTFSALEDAGIAWEAIENTNTGVFVGLSAHDYGNMQMAFTERANIGAHTNTGNSFSVAAGRLSYIFNLKGPCVAVDTACSSSLTAVHLACQSIWRKESSAAIAGGVNAILNPELHIGFSKGGFLSSDARCKSFSEDGNGFVRSEGAGIVVLKPLSVAQREKNPIYAVIRGTAVNQDGRTNGIAVPDVHAQIAMLEKAYTDADVDPGDVQYVEAHGPGTPVGDPIEANSIGTVIGQKQSQHCWIGSVKSNIGHLEPGSGIAGLVKLALSLKHKQIPANLHFNKPNSNIAFDKLRLKVPTQNIAWPQGKNGNFAGINSFGFGGSNAHAVLQGYESVTENTHSSDGVLPLLISARSAEALQQYMQNYIDFLQTSPHNYADICYSAAHHKSHFAHRCVVVASSKNAAAEKLQQALQDPQANAVVRNKAYSGEVKSVLVFSGQGPQWWAMGRELLENNSTFRETIARIDKIFIAISGWSIVAELQKEEQYSRIDETDVAQPALFALQVGVSEVWKSMGITAEAVVGHSIGEVAASYVCGALTLEDAVKLIFERSRIQAQATGHGKMLAAKLSQSAAQTLVANSHGVSIAAVNAPDMVTLSGDSSEIDRIAAQLDREDIFHRLLRVNVPFHSHYMEPLQQELLTSLRDLQPRETTIPFYSTVYGRKIDTRQLTTEYWYKNVRDAVLFSDAIENLVEDGYLQFIEIGPHPIHASGITAVTTQKNVDSIIAHSLRRKENDAESILQSWSKVYSCGGNIALANFFDKEYQFVKLPSHPFIRERYWLESPQTAKLHRGEQTHPLLERQTASVHNNGHIIWEVKLDSRMHNYIRDHRVQGPIVYPGAGLVELALSAAQASFGDHFSHMENFEIKKPVFLPEEGEPPHLKIEIIDESGEFYIYMRTNAEERWKTIATGEMKHLREEFTSQPIDMKKIRDKVKTPLPFSREEIYEKLNSSGLQLGETFQGLHEVYTDYNGAYGVVDIPQEILVNHSDFFIHPGLLDSCLQAAWLSCYSKLGDADSLHLPVRFHKMKFFERPQGTKFYVCSELVESDERDIVLDFWIFDDSDKLIAECRGFVARYLHGARKDTIDDIDKWFYKSHWQKYSPSQVPVSGKWLVFADHCGYSAEVLEKLTAHAIVRKGSEFCTQGNEFTIDPQQQQHMTQLLQSVGEIDGILYMWALDNSQQLTATEIITNEESSSIPVVHLLQELHKRQWHPCLWTCTAGAQNVMGQQVNLSQAAFRGVARTIANEFPLLRCHMADLGHEIHRDEVDTLIKMLCSTESPSEIALRKKHVYYNELVRYTTAEMDVLNTQSATALGTPFVAEVKERGAIDSIVFRHQERRLLQDSEIEVEVHCTALNFRDVMVAMDLLEEAAMAGGSGRCMGHECAGIVRRVGKNVTDFVVGDKVFGFAANAFAGFVVEDYHRFLKLPTHRTYEESTALPMVCLTAYYGLIHLSDLQRGERVLIHSATGGVGIAAIKMAQKVGAEIYATAGSEEKRQFLRELGVKHVFNSRSLDFAQQIQQITNNEGVDVVLNSLSGAAIYKSLSLLRPFGRFVEIGKTDIYRNSQIGLKNFGDNISYFVLDADRLLVQKPVYAGKMFAKAMEFFGDNQIPTQTFPMAKISDALRFMASSRHMGKIVICNEGKVNVLPATTLQFKQDATYVITGGTSGIGLQVAKWMVHNNAQNLLLLSRSGKPKTHSEEYLLDDIRKMGARIVTIAVDISDENKVAEVFGVAAKQYPPIRGIIHAATILHDKNIVDMSCEDYTSVLQAKAVGAWNLHRQSQGLPLDFFVCFSSISSIYGNPGQANYAAANSFLDELAHFRRSQGQVATTINWGALGGAGLVARNREVREHLYRQGWYVFTLRQMVMALKKMLLYKPIQCAAMSVDWQKVAMANARAKKSRRFATLISTAQQSESNEGSNLKNTILADSNPLSLLINELRKVVVKVLGTPQKFDDNEAITVMGLDSLMATQILTWIHSNLGIDYPMMRIMRGPSLRELCGELLQQMSTDRATQTNTEQDERWIVRYCEVKAPRLRLFCFPYFAGGASAFASWHKFTPNDVEVCAIQMPGREERFTEEPIDDFTVLIPKIVAAIKPLLDAPFAFYAHSFGAIIATEVLRKLQEDNVTPQHFIVGSWGAPHAKWPFPSLQHVSVDEIYDTKNSEILQKHLLALEVPQTTLQNSQLMTQMMPSLKADVVMVGKRYKPQNLKNAPYPITAIAGEKDSVVDVENIKAWQECTPNFNFKTIDGGHLFLRDNPQQLMTILKDILT